MERAIVHRYRGHGSLDGGGAHLGAVKVPALQDQNRTIIGPGQVCHLPEEIPLGVDNR